MNVASICSKYFICFRHMFASVLIWILHMFHTYVARACSKYFCVAASVFMLQVISVYVEDAYVAMARHVCCKCVF
jgi:hypothetical protein